MEINSVHYSYLNGRQKVNPDRRMLKCGSFRLKEEVNGIVTIKCLCILKVECVDGEWIPVEFSPHSLL